MIFTRGKHRNEEDGNTLFITDKQGGNETVLFDNYNSYLDFRRVEYLTVEDGANNNEIYEIVTTDNANITTWDNEIYVTNGGATKVRVGGDDYVIGSSKADAVSLDLGDLTGGTGDASGTIDLSGLTSADTVTVTANISSTDKAAAEAKLKTAVDSGKDGKATITFDKSEAEIKVVYENLIDNSLNFTETYDFLG